MNRLIALLYGLVSYLLGLITLVYAVGFVSNLAVPKSIDTGVVVPTAEALIVNLVLMSVFAIQHSVMARRGFKAWWTRYVPAAVERSTYVLFSNLVLILLLWKWQPLPAVVWRVESPPLALGLAALSLAGWGVVFLSTFLINHFDLFGLKQVFDNLRELRIEDPQFHTPFLYKIVRHPLYLGFIIAFWATPQMTVGHLLFAIVTTGYILGAIMLEERDMVAVFGQTYRNYQARVSMIVPLPPRGK